MNSLMKDCLHLNAQAIVLMQEGRHVESSLTLRNALEKLEACIKLPSAQGLQKKSATKTEISIRHPGGVPAEPVVETAPFGATEAHAYKSVSIESKWTHRIQSASSKNVFTFYPRMFHISSTGGSKVDLKKTLLILMFNEAVSRHIIAALYVNEHKISPHHHLSKVMSLYQSVVKAARASFRYQDAREMLCVIVAATNNFGHIASQRLLFSETRDSIDYMIRLLGMSDDHSFGTEDVHLFFESICIFLEGRNLRNAPAA